MGLSKFFAFLCAAILVNLSLLNAENDAEQLEGAESFEGAENNLKPGGKHILIFGGNGFMGASTVTRLLEKGYTITIVNRGMLFNTQLR